MVGSTVNICDHTFLPQLIDSSSVVIDLGAYDGDFAQAVIDRFHCKVISAEPVRELAERIQPHPLLRILPVAVGGKDQSVTLNVFDARCASVFAATSPEEQAEARTVEMISFEEFCRRAAVDRMDVLKLDIEGAEIELFDSLSDKELQSATQITVEFHDFLYPEQRPAINRIRERMQDIGFWVLPFSFDNSDVLFLSKNAAVGRADVTYLRSFLRYGKRIARRLRAMAT